MKFGYKVLSSGHCILEEEWRTFQPEFGIS